MNSRTVIAAIILSSVLAGGIYFVRKTHGVQTAVPIVQSWEKSKGPAYAPVKIVEYSDFQCPACMRVQPTLAALMKEYPGKIRITFKHYPLPMHRWASVAHQAAECANVQGKFWEFHDKVYDEQALWSEAPNAPEYLISYAKDAGVDLDKFGACLSSADVTKRILEERATGTALILSSTPTFFINGERVVGQVELENNGRNIVRKILGLPSLPPPALSTELPSRPLQPPVPENSSPGTTQN